MSKQYDEYLKTDYWKAVSDAVKRRAGYRCQLCNSQHDLCAHHRTYDHRGRELEYLDDLTCLCRRCHKIFHGIVPEPEAKPEPLVRLKPKNRKKGQPYIVGDIESAAKDMPDGEQITLTDELIARCRTNGAFTSATVQAFGLVPGEAKRGWPSRLIGVVLSRQKYLDALRGRHIYVS